MSDFFSTGEVARCAGLPQPVLSRWADRGLVRPERPASGSAEQHEWSEEDAVVVTAAERLHFIGLQLKKAALCAGCIRAWPGRRYLIVRPGSAPEPADERPSYDSVVIDLDAVRAHVRMVLG